MNEADSKLHRLLGDEPAAWLVRRVRDRLESGRPLTGTVTLSVASPEQRRAVERLTGRAAGSGVSLSVSLAEVDRILRDSGAAPGGLAEAVTHLTGPIRDRRRERADLAAAWAAAFAVLDACVADRTELASWRAWRDTTGGQPGQNCRDLAEEQPRPIGFRGNTAQWATAGVHLDELSSLVLCLGLPGDARTPLGRTLASCCEEGQPVVLTLRQLRCHGKPLPAGRVRICENPVVVAAAADELGARCRPLICVGGQPSAAGWQLLELLAAGGADFAYHGDFDWGGIRIANSVGHRVDWLPWRYDHLAYEADVSMASPPEPSARLVGESVATPWDPELAVAMGRHQLRIEEELTLDALLQDLST